MNNKLVGQTRRLAWIVTMATAATAAPWVCVGCASSSTPVTPDADASHAAAGTVASSIAHVEGDVQKERGESEAQSPADQPSLEPPARTPTPLSLFPTPHQSAAATASQRVSAGHNASVHVYTNEDLKRYVRPEDRASEMPPTGTILLNGVPQAQVAVEEDATSEIDPVAKVDAAKTWSEAQARMMAAQDQVELLRRQTLADSNPLLPPPAPLSETEKARRQGMPRDQILQLTRDELRMAELELAAAKTRLETLKAGAPR